VGLLGWAGFGPNTNLGRANLFLFLFYGVLINTDYRIAHYFPEYKRSCRNRLYGEQSEIDFKRSGD
jgi:hypothetical protein